MSRTIPLRHAGKENGTRPTVPPVLKRCGGELLDETRPRPRLRVICDRPAPLADLGEPRVAVFSSNPMRSRRLERGPWPSPRPSLVKWPFYGHGPGPGVESKKPETVPLNVDEVVVPVVLTTTTKLDCAGTVNEYDTFGTVVPKPTTPLSPR
jgi:hypothetical protein